MRRSVPTKLVIYNSTLRTIRVSENKFRSATYAVHSNYRPLVSVARQGADVEGRAPASERIADGRSMLIGRSSARMSNGDHPASERRKIGAYTITQLSLDAICQH